MYQGSEMYINIYMLSSRQLHYMSFVNVLNQQCGWNCFYKNKHKHIYELVYTLVITLVITHLNIKIFSLVVGLSMEKQHFAGTAEDFFYFYFYLK